MFNELIRDLKYSFRMMRNNPGFTFTAVFTLALGIGANTFVFSIVDSILLKPLPYTQPDRLVRLLQSYPEKGLDTWSLSQANFARYRDENQSFEALAAFQISGANLTGVDKPERVQMSSVTADFFKVLGVSPIRGRTFKPEEDAVGRNNVCILSYGAWQRRFGGDEQILGKKLILNDVSTEIIGVMSDGFKFPRSSVEVWAPLGLNTQAAVPWSLTGIGRLKPGLTSIAAQRDTTSILWNFGRENPQLISRTSPLPSDAGLKTIVTPLKETIVGKTESQLLVLQCAVAFVLLIACANVISLLLSQAPSRTREIALRMSIGATPGRVIRQLITESVLLAFVGAIAGIVVAWWGLASVRQLSSVQSIPRIEEVGISGTVLLFMIAVTVFTGILFGLTPALKTYRLSVKTGLSEGQKVSVGGASHRMNGALIAAQLGLSLVLLIGMGLLLKSFQRLSTVNPGFRPQNVLTMITFLTGMKYGDWPPRGVFYQGLLERVRALPGIQSAAVASNIPFGKLDQSDGYLIGGREQEGGDSPQAQLKVVSPDYFKLMGMTLLYGREFSEMDNRSATRVVIVDQSLARRYWPNGDAIGKQIRPVNDPEWNTIVGVVSGVKDDNLAGEVRPHIYFSYQQFPMPRMYLVVRSTGESVVSFSQLQGKIWEIDPNVPTFAPSSMTNILDETLNNQRSITILLTAFAVAAVLMTVIGVYGVMLLYVTSRKPEFAIRLAIGSQPANLLRSVMKEGFIFVLAGVCVGMTGAWFLTRAISGLLFEVSATDLTIFTVLPLFLALVALVTCFIPACKAAYTDPMLVLRSE